MSRHPPDRRALLGAFVAALMAGQLPACARSDPERELRATIATMAQAIERREPADFLGGLAEDFTRESSAFGKQDAKRVLAGLLLRNEKITVSAVVTDLQIAGDRAQVRLRVVATGGAGVLPERGQTWEFDSAWRRVDGRWQVFNAEWREGL
jgi:hypothetical protein